MKKCVVVRNCCVKRMRSGIFVLSIPFELLCILTWVRTKEMNSEARLSPPHGGACIEYYPGMGCEVLTNGNVKSAPFHHWTAFLHSFQLTVSPFGAWVGEYDGWEWRPPSVNCNASSSPTALHSFLLFVHGSYSSITRLKME